MSPDKHSQKLDYAHKRRPQTSDDASVEPRISLSTLLKRVSLIAAISAFLLILCGYLGMMLGWGRDPGGPWYLGYVAWMLGLFVSVTGFCSAIAVVSVDPSSFRLSLVLTLIYLALWVGSYMLWHYG